MYKDYFEKEYSKIREYERLTNTTFLEFVTEKVVQESKKYAKKENNIKFLMMLLSFLFGMFFILGIWSAFTFMGKELLSLKGLLIILLPCLPISFVLLRWIFKIADDPKELAQNELIKKEYKLSEAYLMHICPTDLIRGCYVAHNDMFKLDMKYKEASIAIKKELVRNALSLRGQTEAKQFIKKIIELHKDGIKSMRDSDIPVKTKKAVFKKYRRFMRNGKNNW